MPAETIAEIPNVSNITAKGKIEENKDGERKQIAVVGFDFIGGTKEMDIVLIAVEGNHAVNVVFNIVDRMNGKTMRELPINDVREVSCKSSVEEDKKTGAKWIETAVSFEYDGQLSTMDTVFDGQVKKQDIGVKFTMNQHAMVDLKTGEIKSKKGCRGCPLYDECPVEIVHNSLECTSLLKERGEM